MSIVSKLFIAAGSLCVCLASFQSAKAVPIDLGASGVVTAGTAIMFDLPQPLLPAGNYDFEFIVDGEMGHIQLNGPTTLNLYVDTILGSVFNGAELEYSYDLSDMNHNILPNTHRVGDLLPLVGGVPLLLNVNQTQVTNPINPADLEQGAYFHDIHFILPEVTDMSFAAGNAALVFNQDVELGVWVPEPGSYAALGSLAMVGLGFGAFRRRKTAKK